MDLSGLSTDELLRMRDTARSEPQTGEVSGGRITVRPQAAPNNSRPLNEWSDEELLAARGKLSASPWMGRGKAAVSGVAEGVAGLAGLGGDVGGFISAGVDKMGGQGAGQAVLDALRFTPIGAVLNAPNTGTVKKKVEEYTGEFYKPQTTDEKYIKTAASFIPGAVAAPGGAVGNAVRYGLIPGLASEGAGQVTEGTALEPAARFAGALFGGIGAGMIARPGTASRAIREQLPPGVTPDMVTQAEALMQRANQQGITLSWPEALSQVAGRPVLSNIARHLEASPQTEARMAEFYAPRAQQVEAAGRQTFDTIAPVNPAPSTIGPQAGAAAEGVANQVRGTINQAADPFYRTASPQRLSPQEFARVQAAPGWEEARNAVRNDPQINRHVANLPDDSIGFLNEVKKYLDQAGQNAVSPAHGQQNLQRAAGYGMDAGAVRDTATRASPDYAYALNVQRTGREQYLTPLMQGPIGRLAQRDITTQRAIEALFPSNPIANSEREIAQAVGALARRNSRAASDLVRAHVERVFNEATQANIPGANQMGGAKFAAELVGNPQQLLNLEAAVTALPNGAATWAGFERFLEAVQATGTRQNVGSKTAYNTEMLRAQSSSGLVGEGAKAIANPLRGAQFLADRYERWRLGRNLNELAEILTDPGSANMLRNISRLPPNSPRIVPASIRAAMMIQSATHSQPVNQPRQ